MNPDFGKDIRSKTFELIQQLKREGHAMEGEIIQTYMDLIVTFLIKATHEISGEEYRLNNLRTAQRLFGEFLDLLNIFFQKYHMNGYSIVLDHYTNTKSFLDSTIVELENNIQNLPHKIL